MRLIDANSIVRSDPIPTGDVGYDQGVEDGRIHVYERIDEAATIEAIPVEWLEKQADFARSEWDYDTCEGIRIVLKAWQKEQEAQK